VNGLHKLYAIKTLVAGHQLLGKSGIRKRPGGKKTKMPILYYRADVEGTTHDVNNPGNRENICLISAGEDGLYGRQDDICNFSWKYR